jgi:small conductance mechanosensitive channel
MIEHNKFNRMVLACNRVTMPLGFRDPRGRRLRDAVSKRPGILNALARSWVGEPHGEPWRNPARTEPRPPGITQSCLVGAMLSFLSLAGTMAEAQTPALPSLPRSTQGTPESPVGKGITAPTEDNPEATAAEATGPISVAETVSDDSVQRKLEKLLPKYPGVRKIGVEIEDGVVTLTGHVADNDARDRLREFVRRVQGVNLVLNQTKTDVQVLTAREYALKQIRGYWDVVARKWLLCLFAFGLVLIASALARVFKRFSETILSLFTGNPLLRSVLGSVIAGLIMIGGVLSALHLLGMTEAVLSFLGLAGVVALAVGFAFRDIAENFIASVMLGVRRPFRVGDFIEVAGKSGVVKSLNTRATVLVSLDGSQVRIPNSVIFKEVLVNKSASTNMRGSFDVIVPWNASIATATQAITKALREHEGFEDDPPPRTLLEAIEPGGIRLRSFFWFPAKGVDRWKLLSDAQLAAKVALQNAGINPSPARLIVQVAGEGPLDVPGSHAGASSGAGESALTTDEVEANLRHDTEAASIASAQLPEDQKNEISQALNVASKGISEEGRNLIGEKDR